MPKGKRTCKILKEIRQRIAEENDIELITSECTYQGDCLGTCPKCEAEVRYLERELAKRQALGKAAVISGMAMTTLLGMSLYGCKTIHPTEGIVPNPEPDTTEVFSGEESELIFVYEDMPEFPGGMDSLRSYLQENIHYPQEAIDSGIEGRVFVNFVVEEDGSITSAKVMRGLGYGCDEEAIRLVSNMPKWKPGTQREVPVRVSYNLPIKFEMKKEE